MVEHALTETAPRGWSALPAALRIGILFLAARVVTTAFLFAAAELSGVGSRFGEGANLATLALGWDAQWYWFLADYGYPSELPLHRLRRCRREPVGVHAGLRIPREGARRCWSDRGERQPSLISVVAGYLGMPRAVPHRADAGRGRRRACGRSSSSPCAPLAALFQVGYAESLFLLWLFLSLWLVMKRRYGWLYLLIPLMAFTRPGVLAFAPVPGAVRHLALVLASSRARSPPRRSSTSSRWDSWPS